MLPSVVFTHRNGVQPAARLPAPVTIGKCWQPAFSTAGQHEQGLPAGVLAAELPPERGLAQPPHRTLQPVRRCHPPPPPVPKPAEILARRGMRVRRNQVSFKELYQARKVLTCG